MNFMDAVASVVSNTKSVTENGAVGYKTTGKNLLDLNFAVSSMRNWDDKKIKNEFAKAYFDEPLLTIKWLFMLRDVRGGMGERRSFRLCFSWLIDNKPEIAKRLIVAIKEYGRFDDMLTLLNTALEDELLEYISDQLAQDIENMGKNKPVSLLAKWLPSSNASSAETKRNAKIIYTKLKLTERQYRKTLAALRKYLNVVEVKMSAKEWESIDYSAVPSRANLIYNDAFLRNDEMRRREYLESLAKGEAKINAGTLFPSDIVHKYSNGYYGVKSYDATLEELWKSLPDFVKEDGNTLVVRDGSGSMTTKIGNTNTSALDVATALSVYFAERASGEFYNKFITFSANPKIIDMSKQKNLRDKLAMCYTYDDCSNTNIEATFDLILETAVFSEMKQKDMPKNLLIVSDMEFDSATSHYGYYRKPRNVDRTLFQEIERKFKAAGYKMPRLIFWNVNSRTNTIPVKENDMGVALVSGFSPAIYKMVLSDKLDPFECLLEMINAPRYQMIEELVKDII